MRRAEIGELALVRPRPGVLVPEEGSATWVPPQGVYRIWSPHFETMHSAGGLEWPHPAPAWGEVVHLRPAAEGAKLGNQALPARGIVAKWCADLAAAVVQGVLHPPRALPRLGEERRIIDHQPAEGQPRLRWEEWTAQHLEQLATGLIDFGPAESKPTKERK